MSAPGGFCILCSDVSWTAVCLRTDQKAVRLIHTAVHEKPDTGISETARRMSRQFFILEKSGIFSVLPGNTTCHKVNLSEAEREDPLGGKVNPSEAGREDPLGGG